MTFALMLVAGASSLTIAMLGARMLAPFYGMGPFTTAAVLASGLLGLAIGMALGGGRADREAAPASIGTALAVAGCWTLLLPWLHRPILRRLEPIGLQAATAIAALLLVALPLILLGWALPLAVRARIERGQEPGGAVGGSFAAFVTGALIAAPLGLLVLLPSFGVTRVALATGLVLVAAALPSIRTGERRGASVAALLAIAGGVALIARPPASAATWAGLVAVAQSPSSEIRVLDRDQDARYLLVDGSVAAVLDKESWTSLQRGPAAIELLKLLLPGPHALLVLGLRGGSVAGSFARDGWVVRAVEPDAAAAWVARERLGLDRRVGVVHAEPRAFVRNDRDRYDAIVVDVFGEDFVPPHLSSREFVAELRRRLAPRGWLALNVETLGWNDPVVAQLTATLRTAFPRVVALPTSEPPDALGSIVLLAGDAAPAIPDAALPSPFDYLAHPVLHWRVTQMDHAWANRFVPETRGAAVLTDDRNPAELGGERINRAARRELHAFFGPRGRSW